MYTHYIYIYICIPPCPEARALLGPADSPRPQGGGSGPLRSGRPQGPQQRRWPIAVWASPLPRPRGQNSKGDPPFPFPALSLTAVVPP